METPRLHICPRHEAKAAPRKFGACKAGFSLVEVMMAFSILILCIAGSIATMMTGFRSLDTARCGTLAAQIMQSQIEKLRMEQWTTLCAEPADKTFSTAEIAALVPTSAADTAARFSLRQQIQNATDHPTDMKEILITVTWNGVGNVPHTRVMTTRYAQNGLYSYYYSAN